MSLNWSEGFPVESRAIEAALAEVVRQGVRAGLLSATADPELIAQMAWDAYLGALRRAVFDGWTVERISARIAAAVEVLLDGFELHAPMALGAQALSAPSTPSLRALRG
jgi:hypothetical protein